MKKKHFYCFQLKLKNNIKSLNSVTLDLFDQNKNILNNKQLVECQQGHYGRDCSQTCSTNCHIENQCNRFNGECDEGCKPGWTGITCDQSKTFISHQKLLYILR